MYQGGHGNAQARWMSRLWTKAIGLGILPGRWVTLEVPGRRSGVITRFPLGMADLDGDWYLVSMLGNHCNWVRNVRAGDGRVTLVRRHPLKVRLQELPPAERAPILKRYLQKVPGARPHIAADRHAPLAEFASIAADYPVFRVSGPAPARLLLRRAGGSRGQFVDAPDEDWERGDQDQLRRSERGAAEDVL